MVESNEVLDMLYDCMVAIAADGSELLSPLLDPFLAVAFAQPKFAARRAERLQQTVRAPDGTLHLSYELTLAEARTPKQKGGAQATPRVIELAQRMANGALVAMRDTKRAIADKLSSQGGANSAAATGAATVRAATKGAHVMNDQ